MSATFEEIMGTGPYELGLTASVGIAVAKVLKRIHPKNTAKCISQELSAKGHSCEPKTAENILAGHLSGKMMTALVQTYGWRFWSEVGTAVIGQTYENFIEQELEQIADQRRRLEELERATRNNWARLHARRALDSGHLSLVSEATEQLDDADAVRNGKLGAGRASKA